ncbi:hypothetical protein GCM10028783_24710 [Modestobacter muralis]
MALAGELLTPFQLALQSSLGGLAGLLVARHVSRAPRDGALGKALGGGRCAPMAPRGVECAV